MHGEGRGSAAYVLWVNQRPAVVIDMGGDTPAALARVGVGASQIDTLLITHLHADHVSGFSDFLWGEMTANRTRPLTIVGPDGGNGFTDLRTFLKRLIGMDGAFAGMHGLLDGRPFRLDIHTIPVAAPNTNDILSRGGLRVYTHPVLHGNCPTLAYRIDGQNFRVVLGSDQTGLDPEFSRFALGADLLVLHAMVTDAAAADPLARSVGLPSDLGVTANQAKVKRVVLGHLMKATSENKDSPLWSLTAAGAIRDSVARIFAGKVDLANDLDCFPLADSPDLAR
jgi:ribonuclease BN (tRNA processing enzyme)